MSALPDAVQQNPACGTCHGETRIDGDAFICEDCQLSFDPDYLNASFLDPNAAPCNAPCDNTWHGDHRIKHGVGYDCSPCKLPTGHLQSFHWTGCQSKKLAPQQEANTETQA